ncbi:hypothetical protein P9K38_10075 [Pseudomonas sp. 905_Psudmo1]|nr:hypothetical protein [Pseudomonas sp. 905_Psudmo1]WFS20657.1 hypothetical protein P9K38_10075 [Pseudomonas sp. 905_Psudmo1]
MSSMFTPVISATMTSLELVDLINDYRKLQADAAGQRFPSKGFAKLEHKHFLDKVPEVLGERSAEFSADLPDSYGRPRRGYRFPKREACLMAMSYSYELQAVVFDRMTELEEKQRVPLASIDTEEGKLLLIQEMAAKQLALIQQAKQIEQERDQAIATKAQIGSKREASAMATASAAVREVNRLKGELGKNSKHATVIAVERATGKRLPKNAYVALRRWCKRNNAQAVEVADERYGTVKAWPAGAWIEAFDICLEKLFSA